MSTLFIEVRGVECNRCRRRRVGQPGQRLVDVEDLALEEGWMRSGARHSCPSCAQQGFVPAGPDRATVDLAAGVS